MKKYIYIFCFVLFFSCNKEKYFDGPNHYSDDFESYILVEDLIKNDNEQWSFFQETYDNNKVSLDTVLNHTGSTSLKFVADASANGNASKSSIVKQKMAFWKNNIVSINAWYYLSGKENKQWLFLMDLEEAVQIGANPGIRVALVDDELLVEHKYPNPNLKQNVNNVVFPRDEWVNIRLEVKLSTRKKGYIKLWQNGELVILQEDWQTLPKDLLYFQQGTKGMYSNVEFGITANTSASNTVLYVDDIQISTID